MRTRLDDNYDDDDDDDDNDDDNDDHTDNYDKSWQAWCFLSSGPSVDGIKRLSPKDNKIANFCAFLDGEDDDRDKVFFLISNIVVLLLTIFPQI